MKTTKNVIYIGLLLVTLFVGFSKWKILVTSLFSNASYFPNYPFWPLWLPLGILVVVYLVFFLLGLTKKIKIDFKHHVMVLVLFAVVLLARVFGLFSASETGMWWDSRDAPPRLAMERSASRLKAAVEQLAQDSRESTFPTDQEFLEQLLSKSGRMPLSGFRSFGFKAPVKLVVVRDAQGPVLHVKKGDRAGTLYYAVNEEATQYWITMVGLAELPTGKPSILKDSDSQPRVFSIEPVPTPDEE